MTYDQILELLNRGLSPADIRELQEMPDPTVGDPPVPNPAPAPNPDPVQVPETAPAWATELNQNIVRMTNAMHANAIMQQQQPAIPEVTADQALANIIDPPSQGKK